MNTSVVDLLTALRSGDRVALARGITLIESTRPADRELAPELLDGAMAASGKALRLGITGIPGVGKSTLIDALGSHVIAAGHRVAVLAMDPSSQRSGGSILGDKTRMERLSRSEQAFIRPTPSSGMLGGVARRTRETILLCEAAGYDVVLVETVGVGQSELDVDGMTDLNLLLTIAGAGDELQGIKRGIMESADAIVITKGASSDEKALNLARQALANAIPFLPARDSGRRPEVIVTDAMDGTGIALLWQQVEALYAADDESGYLHMRRMEQQVRWMQQAIDDGLQALLLATPGISELIAAQKEAVRTGTTNALKAASEVLMRFRTGA
ncbi:MAG TPA: methylmalonyl Co-A mutase-associated GTPase MeaB [Flavobacteriales bacterium]|nr:methylmalonyl Co-A mutase-associated GTPase MeaB [Flavobacteriales bacterium]